MQRDTQPDHLRADLLLIAPDPRERQLAGVAARLIDIADTVARDAEAATSAVRGVNDHAREIVGLAEQLAEAARLIDQSVQAQATTLAAAQRAIADNEPAVEGLAQSIEMVSSISALIGDIASQSRLLALNAQIEAARAGDHGAGFTIVAREMGALSSQTRTATAEIGRRAEAVAQDVESARRVALSTGNLAMAQSDALDASLAMSGRQREAAAALNRITADTAARLDDAAAGIGRVAATASAVKLLARQIARLAA